MIYIAVDGDDIGAKVGQSVLQDDVSGLKEISRRINAGQALILDFITRYGGEEISGGGDEYVFGLPEGMDSKLEELRQMYKKTVGATLSVGVGASLSEAGKSLAYTKVTGKDKVTKFNDDVESHLIQVHESPAEGEEAKEDKAYLGALDKQPYEQGAEELSPDDLSNGSLIPKKPASQEQDQGSKEDRLRQILMGELNSEDEKEYSDSKEIENSGPSYQEEEKEQKDPEKDAQVEALKQNIAHALKAMQENKPVLDSMKEQNQSLYYSIVLMIRAMIEMASILGIKEDDEDSGQTQQPQQPQAQGQEQQQGK
jgi:hypothetical protein